MDTNGIVGVRQRKVNRQSHALRVAENLHYLVLLRATHGWGTWISSFTDTSRRFWSCCRPTGNCADGWRNIAWVLKNSFQGISITKFVRKLLNVRSQTLEFAEITALVPFSTHHRRLRSEPGCECNGDVSTPIARNRAASVRSAWFPESKDK